MTTKEALLAARDLLEQVTPLSTDCGALCGAACCQDSPDEDSVAGMLLFPEEAPLYDIDYPLLARELELTGAGIRACALNAARMAAAENGEINLERLCRAAREEYQKLGKTFPARFGQRFPTGKELDG